MKPDTSLGTSDREEIERTARILFPDGVVELRVKNATKGGTVSGYFDQSHRAELVEAADYWSGKAPAVYLTLNPVNPIVMPRALNRAKTWVRETTTDKEIIRRTKILVDFDPTRPDGISATDGEHALAVERARQFSDFLRELGWPDQFLCDSGNGGHVLLAIDLPNDAESNDLVRQALRTFGRRFDDDKIKVDQSVYNPGRLTRFYGTLNAKGDWTPERPHRLSKSIAIPDRIENVTAEMLRDVIQKYESNGKLILPIGPMNQAPANPVPANQGPTDDFNAMTGGVFDVRRWLELHNVPVIREKDWEKGGKLYLLETCPFNDTHDHQSSVVGQFENGAIFFRCLYNKCRGKTWHDLRDLVEPGWRDKPGAFGVRERVTDPHRLARVFLARNCCHPDGWTLRFFDGTWFRWNGVVYQQHPSDENDAELTREIKAEFDRSYLDSRSKHDGKADYVLPVTGTLVNHVAKALRSEVILPSFKGMPCWIDGDAPWDVREILPATNGLWHIPSLASGNPNSYPLTPRFLSTFALDYDVDPTAGPPRLWMAFLESVWPDDPECIATLQEWMGYILTPDYRQHKILLIVGPKRGGKGIIINTMTSIVGESNAVGRTFADFKREFGLEKVLGKTLVTISDARLRRATGILTERLLTISANDRLSVPRKYKSDADIRLGTRIVIASNELPRFDDPSGALASRMILLPTTISFYGREDTTLEDRIKLERPQILMWAIEGLKRLHERGHFVQPSSGSRKLKELHNLSSPIGAFVEDCCEVGGPWFQVTRDDLYDEYLVWCRDAGRKYPDDKITFGKQLNEAFPGLGETHPTINGKRVWCHTGIRLKPK